MPRREPRPFEGRGSSTIADIFIACARPDRPGVEQLAAQLEQSGFSVCWDRHITKAREHNPQLRSETLQPVRLAKYNSEKGAREYATPERF